PEIAWPRPVPLGGDELELGRRVDEPANEPRARDAIDVDPLPGYPRAAAGRLGGMSGCRDLSGRRAQPRLEPRDFLLGRPTARGPEEVDGDDVGEVPFQPVDVDRDLPPTARLPAPAVARHRLPQALRVRHDLAVIRVSSGAKQSLDLGVGEAIHEVGLADGGLPAARHDLPALPLEVFDRLVRPGEHVDRVLDRDRAETLQPAPYLHPEVVGLGRDLMDEQDPTVRSGLRHEDVTSQTNLLTITSVSCENFPSKTSLDRYHLTGGDMGQRISALAALLLIMPARQQAQQPLAPIDWKQVDAGLGKSGALQPDGAYKVWMLRSDLHVTIGGVAVKPALALGSWVAFKPVSDTEAMLMGDLVLLESEVGPVLGKLQDGAIEQTALHNHVLHESPRVMYMHIGGHGTLAKLAVAIHAALALTQTPLGASSPAVS